jgi:predicted nucleic acid-binding protein
MPEMIIVNTSPIFYLHRLGLLEMLNKLYGDITIPEAVRNELEKGHVQGEDVPQLENYPWIQIITSMPSIMPTKGCIFYSKYFKIALRS